MSDDDMYWPDKHPWSRRPAPRTPARAPVVIKVIANGAKNLTLECLASSSVRARRLLVVIALGPLRFLRRGRETTADDSGASSYRRCLASS